MDNELINGVSFIKSSVNRHKILHIIGTEMKTPAEISKKTDIRLNHVSMYLRDLKQNGLVECLNETAKKGRLYHLTGLGKKVIDVVER